MILEIQQFYSRNYFLTKHLNNNSDINDDFKNHHHQDLIQKTYLRDEKVLNI